MSSLTNIVKSTLVVDDRFGQKQPDLEVVSNSQAILKRHVIERSYLCQPVLREVPTQQSYLEEFNRLKIEVKEAKEELQRLNGRISKAKAEEESLIRARQEYAVMSEEEADAAAQNVIEEAKAEAEKILGDSRDEGARIAEQSKNDGYLEGFSKGYEEANREFKAKNDPLVEQIGKILEEMSAYRQEQLHRNEQNMIQLAMSVARKVIGRTLDTEPTVLVDMLRGIIAQNSREQYIKISLSPDLAPANAPADEEIQSMLKALGANITVLTDPALKKGGVTVETPGGIVDMSVQTQLKNLTDALLDG